MTIDRRRLLALLLVAGATRGVAAPRAAPDLPPEDAALVARAVGYLRGLTNARGRFVQTDSRGGVSEGTFTLQRPGKARFDYDPPSGVAVASDGHEVTKIDRRLGTIQSYPLALTPLALFLARDIRLDRGVVISQVIRSAGAFTVVARDGRRKAQGQITLTFADAPLSLTGWAITDPQGATVRVRLTAFAPSAPREARFFELYHDNPQVGAGR